MGVARNLLYRWKSHHFEELRCELRKPEPPFGTTQAQRQAFASELLLAPAKPSHIKSVVAMPSGVANSVRAMKALLPQALPCSLIPLAKKFDKMAETERS